MKNLFITISLIGLWACASTKRKDAKSLPVATQVLSSEIRDIHLLGWEASGERDLHLKGQLLTKKSVGDTIQIRTCDSCLVRVMSTSIGIDTLIQSKTGGEFLFNGPLGVYELVLENEGFNKLEIRDIDFIEGGINRIVIVNAVGTSNEVYRVKRQEHNYSWILDK